MASNNGKAFFEVDQSRLDEEWVRQPAVYYDYATRLADARLTLEEAKTDLEVIRADYDIDIRGNPETYDLEKTTEKLIESVIAQQDEYQKALRNAQKAKHEVDLLQAATQALDHKKQALQSLVNLHGQNYFATPKAEGAGQEVAEELEKKAVRRRRRRRSE